MKNDYADKEYGQELFHLFNNPGAWWASFDELYYFIDETYGTVKQSKDVYKYAYPAISITDAFDRLPVTTTGFYSLTVRKGDKEYHVSYKKDLYCIFFHDASLANALCKLLIFLDSGGYLDE